MEHVRFKFAPKKALTAIHWMLKQRGSIDLHTILKACYFADKDHLNQHWRPIFGARYKAMRYGPVPLEVYEMLKGEPYWLAELGLEEYPWELKGYYVQLRPNKDNLYLEERELSDTDVDAIREGFDRSRNMTFNARTQATHGYDWQVAQLGYMHYEDMLKDNSDRDEIVKHLEDAALMNL